MFTYRVGMQHSEEVRAGEELGAGGLQQEGDPGPGASWSRAVLPPEL